MMRKLFLFLTSVVVLTACDNFDSRLRDEAATYTEQHCPRRLDAYTVLDSMVYRPDTQTLERYFTINDASLASLRRDSAEIARSLVEEIRNDAELKDCKDHGIRFSYIYIVGGNADSVLRIHLLSAEYNRR